MKTPFDDRNTVFPIELSPRAAVRLLNERHRVGRAFLFSQFAFCRRFGVTFPTGLCAGLTQVWWAQIQRGYDAILMLRSSSPELVRDVLLSQLRSIYFRALVFDDSDDTTTLAKEILSFKYGATTAADIGALQLTMGAKDLLQLDLALQYAVPVVSSKAFLHFGPDVSRELLYPDTPGLRLIVTRYVRRKRGLGETGHRCALVVDKDGSCRFYDPSRGEIRFWSRSAFAHWFADYCELCHWDQKVQRVTVDAPPIRVFVFGPKLSAIAQMTTDRLRERIWQSTDCDHLITLVHAHLQSQRGCQQETLNESVC